jgi:phosphatidylglycerol:prolipoprotein diacylglycerol transferase
MSFHGGMLGVAVAIVWYCRSQGINFLAFADRIAVCAPIGLGFGRIANFINGELWGRPAPMPPWLVPIFGHHRWLPFAMIYPTGGPIPRYPSQLFEAALEGLVLFVVMYRLCRHERLRERIGFLTGAFLAGYACARIFCELFRQPDPFLGYLWDGATMGQLLSIPPLIAGIWLMARSRWHVLPRPRVPAAPEVAGSRDATA